MISVIIKVIIIVNIKIIKVIIVIKVNHMIIFLLNFVEFQDGGGRCHSCLDGSQVKSEMKWMLKKIISILMMSHHRMIIYAHHHDDQVREGLRRGLLS